MVAKKEPAAVTGIAAAILNAAVIYGHLGLTNDQQGVLVAAVTIVAGFFIRAHVTPVA